MRRLLKNLRTREYFGQGQWTPDPGQAQDFPNSGKVIDTCLKYHLTDVELVLQLTLSHKRLSIPIYGSLTTHRTLILLTMGSGSHGFSDWCLI